MITQTRRSRKSELEHASYQLIKISGAKSKKLRVSLRKRHAKGYGALKAVGSKMDDPDCKMEGGRRCPAGEDDRHGGPPLPATTELAGASEIGPRGQGLTSRRHGDDAGAMATSAMPFARPERSPRGACHYRRRGELAGAHENGPSGLGSML
jgi:hypothetical protein